MALILYEVTDSDNVVNKTLNDGMSIEIKLKRDIDQIYPSLIIRENESLPLTAFNYCYIEELKRYYFINSIKQLRAGLFELSLSVDVLMTYKDSILNSEARFNRSIKNGDYIESNILSNVNADIKLFRSDETLIDEETLILSTLGVSK